MVAEVNFHSKRHWAGNFRSAATINAISVFVVTLDRHPVGALCLAAVLLASGVAVARARWCKPYRAERG